MIVVMFPQDVLEQSGPLAKTDGVKNTANLKVPKSKPQHSYDGDNSKKFLNRKSRVIALVSLCVAKTKQHSLIAIESIFPFRKR